MFNQKNLIANLYKGSIVLSVVTLLNCGGNEVKEEILLPVKIQTVEGSGGNSGLKYSAVIKPDVEVDLSFKVNGYIEYILQIRGSDGRMRNVQEGDFVRRGTTLARIRNNEYKDAVNEALAMLNQAKADYNRATQLYENNTISKSEYDAAFAKYSSYQARYNQANINLNDCSLVAPMDGFVLDKNLEIGTLVGPGQSGFVIADTRLVKISFGVPDVAVKSIKMGTDQKVIIDAVPGKEFEGKITRISPAADPNSRVFEVDCTIPNHDDLLKVGMIAAINLKSDTAMGQKITIPINAIVRYKNDMQSYAVYIVEKKDERMIARIRKINIAEIVGNSVTVTEGLTGGEQIIISGAAIVNDSQQVKIIL